MVLYRELVLQMQWLSFLPGDREHVQYKHLLGDSLTFLDLSMLLILRTFKLSMFIFFIYFLYQ